MVWKPIFDLQITIAMTIKTTTLMIINNNRIQQNGGDKWMRGKSWFDLFVFWYQQQKLQLSIIQHMWNKEKEETGETDKNPCLRSKIWLDFNINQGNRGLYIIYMMMK